MASYKGKQLCEAISRSLKTNLEALFKEIELFRDCSLITIIWPSHLAQCVAVSKQPNLTQLFSPSNLIASPSQFSNWKYVYLRAPLCSGGPLSLFRSFMASPCYDLVPGGAFAAFTTQVQAKMMLNRGLCSSCVLYFLILVPMLSLSFTWQRLLGKV